MAPAVVGGCLSLVVATIGVSRNRRGELDHVASWAGGLAFAFELGLAGVRRGAGRQETAALWLAVREAEQAGGSDARGPDPQERGGSLAKKVRRCGRTGWGAACGVRWR